MWPWGLEGTCGEAEGGVGRGGVGVGVGGGGGGGLIRNGAPSSPISVTLNPHNTFAVSTVDHSQHLEPF